MRRRDRPSPRASCSFGQYDDLDEVSDLLGRVRLFLELLPIVDGYNARILRDSAEETLLHALRLFDHVRGTLRPQD